MPRKFTASVARRLANRANEKREVDDGKPFKLAEKKRVKQSIANLPNLIEKEWLPTIRSAAKAGWFSWEFQVLSSEEADAACQILEGLGFLATNICGCSKALGDLTDGPISSAVRLEWHALKIKGDL